MSNLIIRKQKFQSISLPGRRNPFPDLNISNEITIKYFNLIDPIKKFVS